MSGIVITNAGFQEVINAEANGTAPVVLARVGFGRGQYEASATQTALVDEFKQIDTIAGGSIAELNVMHMTVNDASPDDYAVYEVGIYTDSGVLFAVYSQTTPIVQKVAASEVMMAIDIALTNVNPESVTVGDTNFDLGPATTTRPGVIALATAGEVSAGTDATKAITPATLLADFPNIKSAPAGFQKLPNGLIIQWGKAQVKSSASGITRVTFPVAFSTACVYAAAVQNESGDVANLFFKTGYTTNVDAEFSHNGEAGSLSEVVWLAIGY